MSEQQAIYNQKLSDKNTDIRIGLNTYILDLLQRDSDQNIDQVILKLKEAMMWLKEGTRQRNLSRDAS